MERLEKLRTLQSDLEKLHKKYELVLRCFTESDGSLYTDEELAKMFIGRNDPNLVDKLKEMVGNLKDHIIWIEEEIDEMVK